ncbi:hypothetical protein Glove_290g61 [Diversispora epigaea]|uniref:Uncharacterized protein n=1 Tax=Diversispora epigaea TaxID=1348612 RepID=A0A397I8G7_9GLOM|nr:hypothetical protein Glove_290g61 [Diversispora epigaea]
MDALINNYNHLFITYTIARISSSSSETMLLNVINVPVLSSNPVFSSILVFQCYPALYSISVFQCFGVPVLSSVLVFNTWCSGIVKYSSISYSVPNLPVLSNIPVFQYIQCCLCLAFQCYPAF